MSLPWWVHTGTFFLGTILFFAGLFYVYKNHPSDGVPSEDLVFIALFSYLTSMAVFVYLIPAVWPFLPVPPLSWAPPSIFEDLMYFFGAAAATTVTFYGWIRRLI